MYDLLIKGGRVIDPSQNIDDKLDVAISGDKITTVAKDIPPSEGQQVVNVRDKIVTPGLIDMHCHIYHGVYHFCVEPDIAGVKQGVTTVLDAGTAGEATFEGFLKFIIPPASTRIFCFFHLCSLGIMPMPELRDWDEVNLKAIAATIEPHLDLIKGVKLRLVGKLVARAGVEVVKTAKKAASQFGLPVMIHIGDADQQVSPTLTQEILPLLEPGDILNHIYSGKFGGPLRPDGTVMPEIKAAMERGVIMDTANGHTNFNFEVARQSLAQGIIPTTLSTDLTRLSLYGPTYNLPVTMSGFMGLGLDLKQVITMTTINPARVLREESRIGSLKPGKEADVSILELLFGAWTLQDAQLQKLEVNRMIMPCMTVKSGKVMPAQSVAQPPAVKPQ
jgi:dihydroorotase